MPSLVHKKSSRGYILTRARHAVAAGAGWGDVEKKTLKFLIFQDRFNILLEMRLSGIAEQIKIRNPG